MKKDKDSYRGYYPYPIDSRNPHYKYKVSDCCQAPVMGEFEGYGQCERCLEICRPILPDE